MGAFYGNITVKGSGQEAAAKALAGRKALVTPTLGQYTVVFDSVCDEQDTDAIQTLASKLSTELACDVFALINHDDDVLVFFVFDKGRLIDSYNSCPSYFDFGSSEKPKPPTGGNAKLLCGLFGVQKEQEVENILRSEKYAFQTERHQDLVEALGLPDCAVGAALASFERNEYPAGLSAENMMKPE